MIIKCEHWKKSTTFFRGKCLLEKYDGRPVFGHCVFECEFCETTEVELTEYMASLTQKEDEQHKEAEVERQRLLDQLPKGVELTENLRRHLKEIAVYYVKTGEYYVTDEHEAARLYKCNRCPDKQMVVKEGVMRCALKTCGCYLDNPNNRPLLKGRAKYWALPCDNGHWVEVDEKFTKKDLTTKGTKSTKKRKRLKNI